MTVRSALRARPRQAQDFAQKSIYQKKKEREELLTAMAFLAPGFIGFFVLILIPVISSLFLSFTRWNFMQGFSAIKFNGVQNYINLFKDDWFLASLKNNLIFTLVTVPVGLALGLILANFINKYIYLSTLVKIMFFIPYIASTVAVSIVWMVLLQPSFGPVNQLLQSIGIANPPGWLVDFKWSLPTVMIIYIWQELGYTIIVYMSGLKAIPNEIYEAAAVDGASKIRLFFDITVPMVAPTTFFLLIMGVIGTFRVFDQINVLTQGGPGNSTSVMAFYIYKTAFQDYRMGYATSMAWVLFIVIFAVTLTQWKLQDKFSNE